MIEYFTQRGDNLRRHWINNLKICFKSHLQVADYRVEGWGFLIILKLNLALWSGVSHVFETNDVCSSFVMTSSVLPLDV